jgi:MIP family channel proteins
MQAYFVRDVSPIEASTITSLSQAFAYFIAILLFGGVSDGHFNPAVSIGMAIAGKTSWIKLHAFIIVQFLGGYLGSLTVYGMYKDMFNKASSTFVDLPGSEMIWLSNRGVISIGSGFFNEIIVSLIFMMSFMAIKDMWNTRSPRYIQPFLIALVIIGLSYSLQLTTGIMLNPIRDLTPRLAALTLGWDSRDVMRSVWDEQWWAVGFFGPFIGAIIGSFLYIFLIGAQIKEDAEETIGEVVAYGNGTGGEQDPGHNQWRATVFIPKPQAAGRRGPPPPPMPLNSPYRGVQFQD